jgi:hypothetical protein
MGLVGADTPTPTCAVVILTIKPEAAAWSCGGGEIGGDAGGAGAALAPEVGPQRGGLLVDDAQLSVVCADTARVDNRERNSASPEATRTRRYSEFSVARPQRVSRHPLV